MALQLLKSTRTRSPPPPHPLLSAPTTTTTLTRFLPPVPSHLLLPISSSLPVPSQLLSTSSSLPELSQALGKTQVPRWLSLMSSKKPSICSPRSTSSLFHQQWRHSFTRYWRECSSPPVKKPQLVRLFFWVKEKLQTWWKGKKAEAEDEEEWRVFEF